MARLTAIVWLLGVVAASAQDRTWTTAFDGAFFLTFDRQGGPRGDTAVVSQNWFMATAARPVNRGTFTLTAMLSAEPLTIGPGGYPQILQEGETYRGLQITDHQHPHDLFMQLTAEWRRPIGSRAAFMLAGGPVGEAALGPVAFMHRPSATEIPEAPARRDASHTAVGRNQTRVDHESSAPKSTS